MTVTATSFREAFHAFKDPEPYATQEIDFWLRLGLKLHNADRYGDLLDEALMLFVAHNLTLEFNAKQAADNGQNPGTVLGALTNVSVDKVSYSRDSSAAMDPKAGHWNLSSYGLRWLWLQRMVGAGPLQIGAPSAGVNLSASAWPGVIY
jgi:hypothetical protein